jgi:hypothetical protein
MHTDTDPSVVDLPDDEGWEDVEPEVEEEQTFKSLFDEKAFGDINEMFQYDKDKHSFDYVKLKQSLSRFIPTILVK